MMCVMPKAADDIMNVGRLQGFNVSTHIEIKPLFLQKMDKYIMIMFIKRVYLRYFIISLIVYDEMINNGSIILANITSLHRTTHEKQL